MSGPKKSKKVEYAEIAGTLGVGCFTFVLVSLAVLMFLIGIPYWITGLDARIQHPLHPYFRSGGIVGLLAGLLGTFLMVVMMLYSVRKWLNFLAFMEFVGSMQWWLRFHIVCGVMGPVFIILHGAMKMPTGSVGIAFWCMILVSGSGIFGRYLFGHFPRAAAGRRMDLKHARESLTDLRAQLVAETRDATGDQIGQAILMARELHDEPSTFVGLVMLDAEIRRRSDVVKALLWRAGLPRGVYNRARSTLVKQLKMKRSLASWEVAKRLFKYWHIFHQPLAIAMYLLATIHIFNALLFGGVMKTLFGGV
ncbi:MAG: hypothetical protein H6736_13970 [Alphaproteobacteria bacterium]|nr:hypothetical protein [Alphaproteobacteria bacterium]MCB9692914.1 hypothetical protein [Alphaproteobacteria bacterium]